MIKRIFGVISVFFIFLTLTSGLLYYAISSSSSEDDIRNQIVGLNDIRRICSEENSEMTDELAESIDEYEVILRDKMEHDKNRAEKKYIVVEYFMCLIFVIFAFGYIYFSILKPFDKMKKFADKIASGNFDIPLKYERSNYFGAFTWAFDNMRKEVINARNNEKEAVLNNKTVIATIAHDIKTPIASIRAYSEGLDSLLGSDVQKMANYISVIIRKCDEVTNLTNDLLVHSISDMDKLKIEIKPEKIKPIIMNIFEDNNTEVCTLNLVGDIPDRTVMIDRQRFEQILENLISNSMKYAETKVDISCTASEKDYLIAVRDYGGGIPYDDMPCVFRKFYRGKNAGKKQGSGLGLYISKYIIDKHNGHIKLINHDDGLEAVVIFPICPE